MILIFAVPVLFMTIENWLIMGPILYIFLKTEYKAK